MNDLTYQELHYLDMYDVRITPEDARTILRLIIRLPIEDMLAGEGLVLNRVVKQLEEIANE